MIERIPCQICNREIVKFGDESHDGICRVCRPLGEGDRYAKASFFSALKSGEVFLPTQEDLVQNRTPIEWEMPLAWTIEKNWFSKRYRSLSRFLDYSQRQSSGYISCRSDRGALFHLAFNMHFGVCVYSSQAEPDCYAYTNSNLTTQVAREQHLHGTCPCCGIVQGVFFASRFHMPRDFAFKIARAMLLDASCEVEIKWIHGDDCRWVDPGLG